MGWNKSRKNCKERLPSIFGCVLSGAVAACVSIAIFVSGCASTPVGESADNGSNSSAKKAKTNELMPDPSGKIANIIANPYLQHSGDAPAAAKAEFTRIQGLIKNGRTNDAIAALTKMRQDYPKLSGPAVNLALLYWKQKNYAQAQVSFEQAQSANKYNSDAYTQYAVMLREQGKFTEAQTQYQKALAVWPHNIQAHRDLGVLYDLYLVQPEQALQQFILCDQLSVEPNKEIKGWIIELNRRLNKKPAKAAEAKLEVAP